MSLTVTQPETPTDLEGDATSSQELFNRYVGQSEAEKITGRNRAQISRDSKSGRLPHCLNEQGNRQYKVSDLYQVYGFRTPKQQPSKDVTQPDTTVDETAHKMALMQQQIHSQAETITLLKQHTATLEQTITRLLPAPQPAAAIMPAAQPETGAAPPVQKSLWQRILGT